MALYPKAAEHRVERLIMLGTPNHGAPEAIRNLVLGNNMMNLARKLNENNNAHRLVRRTPSIYQLLPTPPELWPVTARYPADFDLYTAQAWPITEINQRFLDAGRAFWELLGQADPQVPQILIAGCNLETTTGVRTASVGEAILQRETGRIGLAGGDGTVPLASALLPGVETYYVQCVHARLPSHRDVIQGVIDLTFGGRPPFSTELLEPTRAVIPARPVIDPDYEAGRLRECITTQTMTAQDLEKLYFLV